MGPLAALGVGLALGLFRLAVDTPVAPGIRRLARGYEPGSLLWVVNNVYFQYCSLLIFAVSVATLVVASYLTEAPNPQQMVGLIYATATAEQRAHTRRSCNRWDVLGSGAVLALVAAAYLHFSG